MSRKKMPIFLFYIGSTKLSAVKVEKQDDSFFDVTDFYEIAPTGFEKGNVVDIDRAVHDIRRLSTEIGSFSDYLKSPLYLVIETAFSNTYSLSSSIYFQKQKKIYSSDLQNVINQTRNVATIPLSEQVILSVAQSFMVNDLSGIRNPVGLEGTRLGVDLLIGSLSLDIWKKIKEVFKQNGLRVNHIIPKSVAGIFGLLSPEEFKGSTLFLDVGGKLTSLVYVRDERIRRSSWFSFGGENWTQRIIQDLKISEKEARKIKEVFGSVQAEGDFHDEIIPVSNAVATETSRDIKMKELFPLLNAGMTDFLDLLRIEIDRIEKVEGPLEHIVVTGGGAKMEGFLERFHSEFGKPVRLAQPLRIRTKENHLIQPQYASFLGALKFLTEEQKKEQERLQGESFLTTVIRKAKDWMKEYF